MADIRSIFPIEKASEEEKLYFCMVDDALENNTDKAFSNGKAAHAIYLIYKFLVSAQQSIRIYTGRLSQAFDGINAYADPVLADAAIKFLSKEGSRLSIIIADNIDVGSGQSSDEHPLLAAIKKADIKGSVKVSQENKTAGNESLSPYHFIVMDDTAVRVETDTEKGEAYVNFRDPDVGRLLTEMFDLSEKRKSTELISLPATP